MIALETQTIAGGVTAPAGFRASGVACGIKANGKPDMSLLVSETLASAAAVFTTNVAQAAPILVSREHLQRAGGRAAAVVVNSGCANACTGEDGLSHAREMTRLTAAAVGCAAESVLVASTGVIGVKLPMAKVAAGISLAAGALSPDGGADAARAIMTTDPFSKEAAAEASVRGATFRVGGMAKGSGMIEPMMATMLGFLTTDARVEPALLQRALKAAADDTFNAISVDGECSTNDCVFALANGASGVTLAEDDYPVLVAALRRVCEPLAIDIVRGGEGATKLITIRVTGAKTNEDARDDGTRDRQLTAGEDRRARRRSQLGPPGRGGGPGHPDAGPRSRKDPDRPGGAVQQRRAVRRTCSRGSRVSARQGDRAARRSGNGRAGRIADVVLRPDRGLRADQRGLSDVVPGSGIRSGRPEHRWFAAMALSDDPDSDVGSDTGLRTGLPD